MYERILVPTDGSTGSAHVALQALNLAEQYDAVIYPLYVVDSALISILDQSGSGKGDLQERGERATELIGRMAESHGVDAEPEIRKGSPAREILDYAEEMEADVIVAGTHGRTGVSRTLLGSVAESLVRHAECPVMTVRLPETDVTIETVEQARQHFEELLADEGYADADITDIDRQLHVWVGQASTSSGDVTMYLDPVTQRTSLPPQSATNQRPQSEV